MGKCKGWESAAYLLYVRVPRGRLAAVTGRLAAAERGGWGGGGGGGLRCPSHHCSNMCAEIRCLSVMRRGRGC